MLGLLVHALDPTLKLRLATIQEAGGTKECMRLPAMPLHSYLVCMCYRPWALGHVTISSEKVSQSIPSKAPIVLKNPIQPQENHRTLVLGLGVSRARATCCSHRFPRRKSSWLCLLLGHSHTGH